MNRNQGVSNTTGVKYEPGLMVVVIITSKFHRRKHSLWSHPVFQTNHGETSQGETISHLGDKADGGSIRTEIFDNNVGDVPHTNSNTPQKSTLRGNSPRKAAVVNQIIQTIQGRHPGRKTKDDRTQSYATNRRDVSSQKERQFSCAVYIPPRGFYEANCPTFWRGAYIITTRGSTGENIKREQLTLEHSPHGGETRLLSNQAEINSPSP